MLYHSLALSELDKIQTIKFVPISVKLLYGSIYINHCVFGSYLYFFYLHFYNKYYFYTKYSQGYIYYKNVLKV